MDFQSAPAERRRSSARSIQIADVQTAGFRRIGYRVIEEMTAIGKELGKMVMVLRRRESFHPGGFSAGGGNTENWT